MLCMVLTRQCLGIRMRAWGLTSAHHSGASPFSSVFFFPFSPTNHVRIVLFFFCLVFVTSVGQECLPCAARCSEPALQDGGLNDL